MDDLRPCAICGRDSWAASHLDPLNVEGGHVYRQRKRIYAQSETGRLFHNEYHEDWGTVCGPDCPVLIAFDAEWDEGFRAGALLDTKRLARALFTSAGGDWATASVNTRETWRVEAQSLAYEYAALKKQPR